MLVIDYDDIRSELVGVSFKEHRRKLEAVAFRMVLQEDGCHGARGRTVSEWGGLCSPIIASGNSPSP